MTRWMRIGAALLVPLALLAAACGDSTKKLAVGEWTDGLCAAAGRFGDARDRALSDFEETDLGDTKAAKAAFAELMEAQKSAREAFRAEFDRLGEPDIDGGKETVEAFRAQFKENDAQSEQVAKDVAGIRDSADFLTEFLAIMDGLPEPGFRAKLEAVAKDHPEVQQVIDAIAEDPDCAEVFFDETAETDEAAAEAWSSGICTALGTWIADLQAGADRVSLEVDLAGSPDEVKAALVEFFEQGLTDTRAMQRAIDRLDPPPGKDGEAIQRVFSDAAAGLVGAMERLTRDARALDVDDVARAQQEAAQLEARIEQLFGEVAASFDELQQYDTSAIAPFFRQLPECQF